MLRKFFVRLLVCFVALMGIVVLVGCIGAYLAFQRPAFYAELRAQQFSQDDEQAAEGFFQRMQQELMQWRGRSIARQRARLSDSAKVPAWILNGSLKNYDPAQDTHSISIAEKHLNVRLASNKAKPGREWQNARIRIGEDRIDIACELANAKCVLSVELLPTVTSQGRLRLDLGTARIGQLPIPLKTIFRWFPRELDGSAGDVELHLTAATPYFCVNVAGKDPEAPSVKSLKCTQGEMTIEFVAPVFRQRDKHPTARLASSVWE